MSRGDNKIDLYTSQVDRINENVQEVIIRLQNSEVKIGEVKALFEEELDGVYKKAMVATLDKLKEEYDNNLVNLITLKVLLKKYREFLYKGPNQKLTQNNGCINVEPRVMINLEAELRQGTEQVLKKVQNNETVAPQAESEIASLTEIINYKESCDPRKNAEHEKHLRNVLRTDKEMYSALGNKINMRMDKILSRFPLIEQKLETLDIEVNSFDKIWSTYLFNEDNLMKFQEASQKIALDEDLKSELTEEIKKINGILERFLNGEIASSYEKPYDELEAYINGLLTGGNLKDKENLENFDMLIKGYIWGMDKEAFYMGEDPSRADERAEYYDKLEKMKILDQALMGLIKVEEQVSSLSDGYAEANISKVEVDSDSKPMTLKYTIADEFSNREIFQDGKIDLVLHDTEGGKEFSENLANLEQAIIDQKIAYLKVGFTIATAGWSIEAEAGYALSDNIIGVVKSLFSNGGTLSGAKIDEAIQETMFDMLGFSTTADGSYYLDFKPILVMEEFELRGGELPTEEEMRDPEALKNWYYSSPEDGFNILDENGQGTGDKIDNVTNGDMLEYIVDEIEQPIPQVDGSYHPSSGGYGV